MSTLNVASIQSLTTTSLPVIKNSSGVEKGQFVKAYVNFNGQGTIDANSIRSSFNVSSMDETRPPGPAPAPPAPPAELLHEGWLGACCAC